MFPDRNILLTVYFFDTMVKYPFILPGGHCPFYDMEKNIIDTNFYQSCKEHTTPCPNLYHSDVAFKCKH